MVSNWNLDGIPELWWNKLCNKTLWEVYVNDLPGAKYPNRDLKLYAEQFADIFRRKCRERDLKPAVRIRSKQGAWFFVFVQAVGPEVNLRHHTIDWRHARGAPSPKPLM